MTDGVWVDLIGQEAAIATLNRAVTGERHAMSHAWLITGPPGSGRSNAARAFAAALECPDDGCGVCNVCRTVLSGSHPDVTLVRTEQLSIGVEEVRDLARRASMSPTTGPYQIIVVEDADRVTERGADALLKSIEEPSRRTVWMLCAPTADDVVATIRSRCRQVRLVTPSEAAVTQLLISRDEVAPSVAAFAARVAQGHIGRARQLARDEATRIRRHEVLAVPARLVGLGACLRAAADLMAMAQEEAAAVTAKLDEAQRVELSETLGLGGRGAKPRTEQAALKDLEEQQKARAKRLQRDALDRVLSELTAYYRDLVSVQLGAEAALVNSEFEAELRAAARRGTADGTLRRIDAILECREALEGNVAPLLALEALMVRLAQRV